MKKTLWILGSLLGLYFVARAIAWPFGIDPSNPATYANDWGGPTLVGVAAVHCGPGVIAALVFLGAILRGRLTARRRSPASRS